MMRRMLAVLPFCACGWCLADITTGFERPEVTGSAAGTVLTGQDGWYIPVAGSNDSLAMTYAGNALGIPANPTGGEQCLVGRSNADVVANAFARAQRDHDFSAGGTWTAAFDIAVAFNGTLPSAPNLGSFSLQPSTTTRAWQSLYNWVDNNTADAWNCAFLPYDANGVQAAQPGVLPDPAFGTSCPTTGTA